MRCLFGLVCVLAVAMVPLVGCSETSGDGGGGGTLGTGGSSGSAGAGGADGTGGAGGIVGEACVPSERECISSEIDPIAEMCEIIVPDQANACDGTESLANPSSCTPSGNTVTHKITKMQIATDCNAGFDLDGCDGESCAPGGLAPDEGANGVDNGLGATGAFWVGAGSNLGILDQVFHDAICTGGIEIEIEVDAVPVVGCAVVAVSAAGVSGDPVPMNLSDDGCLSGTLGTVPIALGGVQGAIENTVVRMTVSSAGFSDGILGGTADQSAAVAMFEETLAGFGAVAAQLFDINGDLSGDSLLGCDSLSMTLEIGGDAVCRFIHCDDGDACTKNVCNPVDAACEYPLEEDGTLCGAGWCIAGSCEPIGAVVPCTELGLRAAIHVGGGPYTFDCDGPTMVVTEATITIDNDVILDGEGKLTVDGNEDHRVFQVLEGVTAELDGFTVTGGFETRGAGILNDGTLTLTNSTVSANTATAGAGIHNLATLTLTNSTVTGGFEMRGAGILNDGTLTLTNSTVSANTATAGAGIHNLATLTLTNSTVSANTSINGVGAIGNFNGGTLTVTNSVVDGDCEGHATSNGYNIESPGNTCGFDHGTDLVNITEGQLHLGPLADNGGPAETHALGAGSVAIDVIPQADCVDADGAPLTTDQRGEPRPGGTMCDAGAFEAQPDGVCASTDCDDGDACTKNVCNHANGTCSHPLLEDRTLCAEGWCLAGRCEPIDPVFPCTEQGIRNAIVAGGGPYTFDCDGPTTLTTEAEIVIDNDVILDGEGNLEVEGNSTISPAVSVESTVTAELRGFTISRSDAVEHVSRRDLVNQGTLTLTNSSVHVVAELGIAIRNTGTMTLTNSTTVARSGVRAISNFGTMTLTNSTVSADAGSGIAISNSGTITVSDSTVNGIRNVAVVVGATATVANSLIDGRCGTGAITSNGYNIESPGNTCGFDQGTDQVNVSPDDLKLGPLQDNGGPTMTHALGAGSAAIDHIPTVDCEVDEDQRGVSRPQGDACDVGAFELEVAP